MSRVPTFYLELTTQEHDSNSRYFDDGLLTGYSGQSVILGYYCSENINGEDQNLVQNVFYYTKNHIHTNSFHEKNNVFHTTISAVAKLMNISVDQL